MIVFQKIKRMVNKLKRNDNILKSTNCYIWLEMTRKCTKVLTLIRFIRQVILTNWQKKIAFCIEFSFSIFLTLLYHMLQNFGLLEFNFVLNAFVPS